ncbi:hypothetical protein NEUTE1DRAFT_122474 [Neurospora tetrasperma FGSC 2508]|uniref:Uncharacterized protein n=1 Tax=Neurospora tetrasperma (strain FGSC 2508 / ATCC MYA-4615 / P0657) TaxID=510951 RepID=F8MK59_NEUT8|nr:uncharacterized protein NEUTE1DRAFT_122474 [Neurospora tetrasperma FGSC 2508]EGO58192.1 hypothetical protein NEUTE1DRAFT_122474 [Neurospora tetrasperma FGSC 2508]EGZ71492.1 hypothetical protein NEUTE2DRAFT_110101 [Neurospora tetrasperma FGSC 2509]
MPLSATLGHPRVSSRGCVPHAEALFPTPSILSSDWMWLADRRLGRTMSEEPTDIDASLLNTSATAVFISYFDCLDKDLTFLTATEPAVVDKNKVAKHGQWTVEYIVRHETLSG